MRVESLPRKGLSDSPILSQAQKCNNRSHLRHKEIVENTLPAVGQAVTAIQGAAANSPREKAVAEREGYLQDCVEQLQKAETALASCRGNGPDKHPGKEELSAHFPGTWARIAAAHALRCKDLEWSVETWRKRLAIIGASKVIEKDDFLRCRMLDEYGYPVSYRILRPDDFIYSCKVELAHYATDGSQRHTQLAFLY